MAQFSAIALVVMAALLAVLALLALWALLRPRRQSTPDPDSATRE